MKKPNASENKVEISPQLSQRPEVHTSFAAFFKAVLSGNNQTVLDLKSDHIYSADIFIIELKMLEESELLKTNIKLRPKIEGYRPSAFIGKTISQNLKITRYQARVIETGSDPDPYKLFQCQVTIENGQTQMINFLVKTTIKPSMNAHAELHVNTMEMDNALSAHAFPEAPKEKIPTVRKEVLKALERPAPIETIFIKARIKSSNSNGNGHKPAKKSKVKKDTIEEVEEIAETKRLTPHTPGNIPLEKTYQVFWRSLDTTYLKNYSSKGSDFDEEKGIASAKEITAVSANKSRANQELYVLAPDAPSNKRAIADFLSASMDAMNKEFRNDIVNRALTTLRHLFSVSHGELNYTELTRAKLILTLIELQKSHYESLTPEQGQIIETLLTQGPDAALADIKALCQHLEKVMPNPFA